MKRLFQKPIITPQTIAFVPVTLSCDDYYARLCSTMAILWIRIDPVLVETKFIKRNRLLSAYGTVSTLVWSNFAGISARNGRRNAFRIVLPASFHRRNISEHQNTLYEYHGAFKYVSTNDVCKSNMSSIVLKTVREWLKKNRRRPWCSPMFSVKAMNPVWQGADERIRIARVLFLWVVKL